MQGHVARVRRALEAVGMAEVLATRAPGYVLRGPGDGSTSPGSNPCGGGAGRPRAGDASRAVADLNEALGLWRGKAWSAPRGGWASEEADRLEERRLSTIEDRIDADLMLGHHGAAVGELESLVARTRLRERLWGSLMLALYRSGRRPDPVRASRAREVLVGELGWSRAGSCVGSRLRCSPTTRSWMHPRRHGSPGATGSMASPRSRSPAACRRHRRRCSSGGEPELQGLQRSLRAAASGPSTGRAAVRGAGDRQDVPGRGLSRGRPPWTARPCCTAAATTTSGSPISRGSMPCQRREPCARKGDPSHVDARGSEPRASSPVSLPSHRRPQFVRRHRGGSLPAVRRSRGPVGAGLGPYAARPRARRSALGRSPDAPAPTSRHRRPTLRSACS